MITPVEELRSAAALLRQRAEAATKGPWRREFPDGPSTQIASDLGTVVVPGVAARWRWPRAEDADYIATVDPLVGLTLAELLDHIGDDMLDDRAEEAPVLKGGALAVRATVPAANWRFDWTSALALARLILGGDS